MSSVLDESIQQYSINEITIFAGNKWLVLHIKHAIWEVRGDKSFFLMPFNICSLFLVLPIIYTINYCFVSVLLGVILYKHKEKKNPDTKKQINLRRFISVR